MRCTYLLALILALPSCQSIDRLFRNSPLSGTESAPDRVNLWPLYYQNGPQVAVLWPVFDTDEDGFAIRPLLTKDGSEWELLPPLAYLDAESGRWWFMPAYSLDHAYGVVPLFGIGDDGFRHFGPLWWRYTPGKGEGEAAEDPDLRGGLFPLAYLSPGFSHVGPVWWKHGASDSTSLGLFPVIDFGEHVSNVGPVVWSRDDEGALSMFAVFPLFGYGDTKDDRLLVTLLGGARWSKEGDDGFVNVLGPVYNYKKSGDDRAWNVLWPVYSREVGPQKDRWSVWPLVGHEVRKDADGKVVFSSTPMLTGLFRMRGATGTEAVRFAPLFSVVGEGGGGRDFFDYVTLYGSHRRKDALDLHIGTPLLFNYNGRKDGYGWSSLLGTVSYETSGDTSSFSLLYYLYRQRTNGTETRRDFFPFCSWDSGKEHSGFSFLWRLFSWQRNGEKLSGHVLFIPWGEG